MRGWKAAFAALCLLPAAPAAAKCQLGQVAALPVRITGSRILLDAKINGQPVQVILDTGAQASMMFGDAAAALKLPHTDALGAGTMYGENGGFYANKVRIRDFALDDVQVHGLVVWAGGYTHGESVAMLLGRDVLRHWDVEYDIQHGAVRLLQPQDCHGDQVVYWADSYSRASVGGLSDGGGLDLPVGLNGLTVMAELDTGSPHTVVGVPAARAAHVTPHYDGKAQIAGLGRASLPLGSADFDQVSIGGEMVRHTRLQVTDLFLRNRQETTGELIGQQVDGGVEMLLGLDFVRAHRILVVPDQGMIYFTYAGGPVFAQSAPASATPGAPQADAK